MTTARTTSVIAWDGTKMFPNGVADVASDEPSQSPELAEFLSDLNAQLEGGEVLGVLPLAQPGQAVVLCVGYHDLD